MPSECIGIIDSTLACLVSWLEGHSLAQTVFTNLYLHRPQRVQDKPMRAFVILVYKIIDILKEFVSKALVYEEEDFQTMSYGYKLKPDVPESKAIALIKDVEEDLLKRLRNKQFDVNQGLVSDCWNIHSLNNLILLDSRKFNSFTRSYQIYATFLPSLS